MCTLMVEPDGTETLAVAEQVAAVFAAVPFGKLQVSVPLSTPPMRSAKVTAPAVSVAPRFIVTLNEVSVRAWPVVIVLAVLVPEYVVPSASIRP